MIFDYLEGGADDEAGSKSNSTALGNIKFVPRRFVDVAQRDTSASFGGLKLSMPIVVGPTGLNGFIRAKGDLALARAAARSGVPFVLSTASNSSIEEVANACNGEFWFQLYVLHRKLADALVKRAFDVGCSTLIITTDVAVNGYRERDLRNGFGNRTPYSVRAIWDGITHPAWCLDILRHGVPQLANLVSATGGGPEAQAALMGRQMAADYVWDDLQRLREQWSRRLLVKGILSPADAHRCFKLGIDGVVLSNHGGRQLNHSVTAIEQLPAVRKSVVGPLLVDGGFRRGSDIVKAIALGASAVLMGRAPLYALAARGEEGVFELLRLIREDIERTLALIGCPSVKELSPECVRLIARE